MSNCDYVTHFGSTFQLLGNISLHDNYQENRRQYLYKMYENYAGTGTTRPHIGGLSAVRHLNGLYQGITFKLIN